MDTVRVAVVGYGYAGRCFHSYLVRLAEGMALHGVVTSRPGAAEQVRRLGARVYPAFEQALDDPQVDLVVLATPNHLHASQAIQAMAAGKHVVTDKPMCLSLAQADAMIAASRQHGRVLSVFQNRRWDGDYLTVRQVLEEGWLGEVFLMELAWHQYGRPRGWRSEKEHGGGKFLDLGAHLIDQAVQLVPAPVERVYARFFQDGPWGTDVEDHAHAVLSFANGVDVHIDTSSVARRSKPRWYVLGSQGALVKEGLDPQERAMVAGDIDAARELPEHRARLFLTAAGQPAEMVVETVSGRWRSFYENVVAAVQGRAELAVTPESARAALAVIEAAWQSVAEGQAVRPPPPHSG